MNTTSTPTGSPLVDETIPFVNEDDIEAINHPNYRPLNKGIIKDMVSNFEDENDNFPDYLTDFDYEFYFPNKEEFEKIINYDRLSDRGKQRADLWWNKQWNINHDINGGKLKRKSKKGKSKKSKSKKSKSKKSKSKKNKSKKANKK